MEFGKIPSIDLVDFTLPPDPADNAPLIAAAPGRSQTLSFYTGCTGWGMKEWVGTVYPHSARTKDYLCHYAEQFNTIELNTTHYRIPDADMVQRWHDESTPDFRFCPKMPQTISHSRDLGLGGGQIAQFCHAIELLEEKLGACFLQLPPHFGPNKLGQLDAFLRQFPRHIPLAVELRHEGWFNDPEHARRLFDLLESCQTGAVITDVAGRRDVLHMRLSTHFAMVRFVGNNLHPTDYSRLEDWAQRLLQWQGMGLAEAYFFTHEPDNLRAPEAADFLCKLLKDTPGIHTRGPDLTRHAEGQGGQLALF